MTWRIGEILVQKKFIQWDQLEEALLEQGRTHEPAGEILIRKGYISETLFYKTLADQFEMRFVDLNKIHINPKAIELIPSSIAKKYQILPVEINHNTLTVAIPTPLSRWPHEEIKKMAGVQEIKTILCLPGVLDQLIGENYGTELDRCEV